MDMIARLTAWLFYAVVFFLLGAWVGGFSSGLRALLREGAQETQAGAEEIYRWANGTIGKTPTPTPAATVAAPPPPGALDSARAAFARGDVSQAISLYQDLLKQKPDDVDARGELGNVFLSSGRLQEAAETLYETALRLARAGDAGRARALEPIVRRNDPALADKLDAELKALGATGKQGAAALRPAL
jgi:tetratricopeptide (TPR) repeat protein